MTVDLTAAPVTRAREGPVSPGALADVMPPEVSAAGSERSALGELGRFAPRPLGTSDPDLGLDLTDPLGPDALTAVLDACLGDADGRPASREALIAAPVGDRVAALIAIAAITADGRFSVPLQCPVEDCRDTIEIELTWDEIQAVADGTTSDPFDVDAAGVVYRMRRPTAADQNLWRQSTGGVDSLESRDVVASLVVDGPLDLLSAERVAAIEMALDEHDPLVGFGLGVICPTCGTTSRHEPSLISMAASPLRRAQARLFDQIHQLARAYGWSEAAILAVPAWRRARYRALIAADR